MNTQMTNTQAQTTELMIEEIKREIEFLQWCVDNYNDNYQDVIDGLSDTLDRLELQDASEKLEAAKNRPFGNLRQLREAVANGELPSDTVICTSIENDKVMSNRKHFVFQNHDQSLRMFINQAHRGGCLYHSAVKVLVVSSDRKRSYSYDFDVRSPYYCQKNDIVPTALSQIKHIVKLQNWEL